MLLNLQQVLEAELGFFKLKRGYVTEGDWLQNKLSRNKIRAFKREHGACYLGKINSCDKKFELVEYKKGMIYNFEYDMMVPVYDETLIKIGNERLNAPYTGSSSVLKGVEKMMARIDELNGHYLNWV